MQDGVSPRHGRRANHNTRPKSRLSFLSKQAAAASLPSGQPQVVAQPQLHVVRQRLGHVLAQVAPAGVAGPWQLATWPGGNCRLAGTSFRMHWHPGTHTRPGPLARPLPPPGGSPVQLALEHVAAALVQQAQGEQAGHLVQHLALPHHALRLPGEEGRGGERVCRGGSARAGGPGRGEGVPAPGAQRHGAAGPTPAAARPAHAAGPAPRRTSCRSPSSSASWCANTAQKMWRRRSSGKLWGPRSRASNAASACAQRQGGRGRGGGQGLPLAATTPAC